MKKVVYKTRIPAAMANRPAKDPPTARLPAAFDDCAAEEEVSVGVPESEPLPEESAPESDPVGAGLPDDELRGVSGI